MNNATTTPTHNMNDDLEFELATQEWKAKTGRKYPTWSEHLAILKGLGYSKPAPKTPEA